MDDTLGKSGRILKGMARRYDIPRRTYGRVRLASQPTCRGRWAGPARRASVMTNKVIVAVIILVLLAIIGLIIYLAVA